MQGHYDRAKITIEVLIQNMIKPAVLNKVFFEHYREPTPQNTIKLLLRAK